jgi:RNA 2',3'-cyclic 3'-phosphodiesterase
MRFPSIHTIRRAMPRPNFFLAFPLEGHFVRELPPLPPGFRLFHPEDVHLTLAFLGACGQTAAERALEALVAELQRVPLAPIEVSLGKVVPMGARRAYTALSALLERGREETAHAIASLRDIASDAAGIRREIRAPKPHVTVARPRRNATDAARLAGLTWAAGLDLSRCQATLQRVALYTWSEGARRERLFQVLAEFGLKA